MRPARRRILLVSTACCALTAGVALPALASSTASAAGAESPRSAIRGTGPSWVAVPPPIVKSQATKAIEARVFLAPRNEAALDRAAAAVSDPSGAEYGHYVTPAQFRARYGPAPEAATKVTAWLRGAGLRVSTPQQNGRYVDVTGSAADAQRAFGTRLSVFRKGGADVQAPSAALTAPRAVSPYVLSVTGLDESPSRVSPKTSVGLLPSQYGAQLKAKTANQIYPPGFRNAKPCSTYYGQKKAVYQANGKTPLPKFNGRVLPYAVCGYSPTQLRGAYSAPGSLTGKGVTVAIIDAYLSPTLLADANRWARNSGSRPFAPGQFSAFVPAGGYTDREACDAAGWSGEQSLDVEAVHGFAPGAKVLYTAGRSCSGFDLLAAEFAVVDDNRASIVSLSYGGLESQESTGEAAIDTYLYEQAALQGIGFYVASGDNGDEYESTGLKQVDSSASNPYATAVGGTSLGVGAQNRYLAESGWGTQLYSLTNNRKSWVAPVFYGGAGGGFSQLFTRPAYQDGIVPAGSPAGRAVPDVSMDADITTGMKIGLTQQFPNGHYYDEYRVGGTSLSAPLFAAVQALTSQAMGKRLGFANPRIYALARRDLTTPGRKAFRDVKSNFDYVANVRADYADGLSARSGLIYTVRSFDDDTSLATARGWDPVTGIGSPAPSYYTATVR